MLFFLVSSHRLLLIDRFNFPHRSSFSTGCPLQGMSPSHSSHVLACHLKMIGWEQHLRPSAGAPRSLCQTTGLAFASCSFHGDRLLFTYACSSRLLPTLLMRHRAEHSYQFSSNRGKYNFHVVLQFLISSFLFLC